MPRYTQETIEIRRVKVVRLTEADTQKQAEEFFAEGKKQLPVGEETVETVSVEATTVAESALSAGVVRVARLRAALGPRMTADMNALVAYLAPRFFASRKNGRPFERLKHADAIQRAFGLLTQLSENFDTDRSYESHDLTCAVCGKDTKKIGEYYGVTDAVWRQAGEQFEKKMLCIGCLEERLGRQLVAEDFSQAPVNLNLSAKSPRLRQRMGK